MIAYFDCQSGIAGDMIIAALLDTGIDEQRFKNELNKLSLKDYKIKIYDTKRCNIRSKRFEVIIADKQHNHRNLADITNIIESSKLSTDIKISACSIFNKLAEAEAFVHNCDVANVHFHEIGAIDSIIDIVGACICFDLLKPDKILYSKIATGTGTVKSAHGLLNVPAPATAKLLQGKLICSGQSENELATPTGVAIITTLGQQISDIPEMQLINIGYGAGSREIREYPNTLRVFLGNENIENIAETDEISVISFNIDDSTAEHSAMLAEKLFACGATDVIQLPAYMKKSRPGIKFEILTHIANERRLVETILSESTTFGVRISRQRRYKLKRKILTIQLPEGKVAVKLGFLNDKLVQIAPEYEDCRKLADRTKTNFRQVYASILELARKKYYNN